MVAGKKSASGRSPARRHSSSQHDAGNEDSLPKLSRLLMSGNFAEQITIIPKSISSLILSTGKLEDDDRSVLVPCIEMMIAGVKQGDVGDTEEIGDDVETIFSRTVPLENALWLTFDVMRDIRIACAKLRGYYSGEIAIDPARLSHARFFTEQVRMQAEMCVTLLDEIGSSIANPEEVPPRQAKALLPSRAAKPETSMPKRRLKLSKV